MNWLRKIYHWVLSWAESKYGAIALFVLAFIESVIFPIPPDVLLIALVLGAPTKAFRFALICTVGSVTGAMAGYTLGYYAWYSINGEFSQFANFFFNNIPGFSVSLFEHLHLQFEKWNFWVIFTAGFTPIPYKVFTVSAGVFDINFTMFIIASIVSRGFRFFIIAWLLWKYGENIKDFIEKYFNLLALIFTILLIGGFVLLKYVI